MSPEKHFGRKANDDATTPSPKSSEWSPAVFSAIEWRRFEAVCETLFGQAGFETRSQTHGADGGVDIWLYSRHAEGPVAVVQCKHWQGKAVGVKELREFFGVMTSHKLKRGTYAHLHSRRQAVRQRQRHQRAEWQCSAGANSQPNARAAASPAGSRL